MDADRYRAFLDHLVQAAVDDDDIIGLVALGSTAGRHRAPDRWSDHDIWIITCDGAASSFREDATWLPEAGRIVGRFVETQHGRSIVYDDGHLVELAVFDDRELEIARANDYRVLYDAGGIEQRIAAIATRTRDEAATAGGRAPSSRFIVDLIIGLGRCGRGELLSANALIRGSAPGALAGAIAEAAPNPDLPVLDNLDPHRRFEIAYPDVAARIQAALGAPLVTTATVLTDIAEELLLDRATAITEATLAAVRAAIGRAGDVDTTT